MTTAKNLFPAILVSLCLLLSAATPVQGGSAEDDTPSLAAVHAELAWLVGTWVGSGLGGHAEEVWMPPSGGQMIGVFRLVQDDQHRFSEILTIGEFDGAIELRLKHFDPKLEGWEEKSEFVTFPFRSMEDGRVRFGGLEFIRQGDDGLRIELAMRRGGETHTEVFRFERTPR